MGFACYPSCIRKKIAVQLFFYLDGGTGKFLRRTGGGSRSSSHRGSCAGCDGRRPHEAFEPCWLLWCCCAKCSGGCRWWLRHVLSSRAVVRVASCAVIFCGLAARLSAIVVQRVSRVRAVASAFSLACRAQWKCSSASFSVTKLTTWAWIWAPSHWSRCVLVARHDERHSAQVLRANFLHREWPLTDRSVVSYSAFVRFVAHVQAYPAILGPPPRPRAAMQ